MTNEEMNLILKLVKEEISETFIVKMVFEDYHDLGRYEFSNCINDKNGSLDKWYLMNFDNYTDIGKYLRRNGYYYELSNGILIDGYYD